MCSPIDFPPYGEAPAERPVYAGEPVDPWQPVRHANGTIGPACTCGTHAPDPACIHPTHTTFRSWSLADLAAARVRSSGVMADGLFRTLDPAEAEAFRRWARDHHTPGAPVNPLWHPVVREECARMDAQPADPACPHRLWHHIGERCPRCHGLG